MTPVAAPTATATASTAAAPASALAFVLPRSLEARVPPEARGLARDQVRLMVGWRHRPDLAHTVFHRLADYLEPGDVLVVNNSATLPAALDAGGPDGTALELHLSTQLHRDRWVVEPRRAATPASRPYPDAGAGMILRLPGGGQAALLAPYGTPGRLWVAALQVPGPMDAWLARHGRPIRYPYVPHDWPLDYYQTVFAQEAGSAEMPSAARPFSAEMVTQLVSRGIAVAPITLHCAVSSLEAHEAPVPERFWVPETTADLVNQTRRRGSRVIAVGTTVVRALESATGAGKGEGEGASDGDGGGEVRPTGPAGRWTDLVITAGREVRSVDGMITGWHEPAASHLAMLEAVAGRDLLTRSYRAALACRYLWHEFGDSHLILP